MARRSIKLALVFVAAFLFLLLPATAWAHSPGGSGGRITVETPDETPSSGEWVHGGSGEIPWWGPWDWRADVLLVLAFLGTIYVRGWLRLRRRSSGGVRQWRLVSYLAGIGAVFLALISPIDFFSEEFLSVHMVQHLLLIMIAPLCFLLADPLAACLWGLPGGLGHSIGSLLVRDSRARRALTVLTWMPAVWILYVGNLWAWHHPLLYQAALRNGFVHDLEHLLFFGTALLFWWPVVNPAPRLFRAPSYGLRIGYLLAATLQNTLLGMAIGLPEKVLYPFYGSLPLLQTLSPINDQALGGGIMWVSGHMYLLPVLFLVGRYRIYEKKRYEMLSSGENGSPEGVR